MKKKGKGKHIHKWKLYVEVIPGHEAGVGARCYGWGMGPQWSATPECVDLHLNHEEIERILNAYERSKKKGTR